MGMVSEYLTAGDVARRIDRTRERVHQLVASGLLPVSAKTKGGILLFDPADVEALAKQRELRAAERRGVGDA